MPGALAAFLPTWRTAIRHELHTNTSGLAPRKSPTLAQRITDDFPRLDVLRCYTHPITSESEGMGTRGLNSLWSNRADVAKIAHVCEMYFEWGVEATIIKRFRSFLWPGAVFRHLLHTALGKDMRDRNHVGTQSKRNTGGVETPSKALARTLDGITLDAESEDEDDDIKLVVAIHGERCHASTDGTLEYRLEIDPRELVARAKTGIQGLRQELADSAPADALDEDDEDGEDEDEKKKKRGPKAPPPDPDSKLRVWMPAVMVERAYPGLTKNYIEQKTAKKAKKETKRVKGEKSKKGTMIRHQDSEPEEEEESTPAKAVKTRTTMDDFTKLAHVKVSYASAGTSESEQPIDKPSRAGNTRKVAGVPVRPILATSSSNSQSSQSVMATQLLSDDDPFLATTVHMHRNPKTKTYPRNRSQPRTKTSPTSLSSSLHPRPFPVDLDDVFTAPSHRPPAISAGTRKYSSGSESSGDLETPREPYKKSPRKTTEHTSPRKPSRMASPSPQRPILAPQMKPLHRAMARSTTSTSDDEVIIISSDTDDAQFTTKASAKPPPTRIKKTLACSSRLDEASEVIDLTSP
jgi:holliday junction resolvase GEN1/YEN1